MLGWKDGWDIRLVVSDQGTAIAPLGLTGAAETRSLVLEGYAFDFACVCVCVCVCVCACACVFSFSVDIRSFLRGELSHF